MTVYIIGAGCGDEMLITAHGKDIIDKCDILIGSERLVKKYVLQKKVFYEYKAEKIRDIIKTENKDTAVVMSGDTGIYSGTQRLIEVLNGYDVKIIPGISSVSYFSSKIGLPWQDWKIVSVHGRKSNVIGHIRENRYTFVFLNNGEDAKSICKKLENYGMDNVYFYIGNNLSYPDEQIFEGNVGNIKGNCLSGLTVALFVNENHKKYYGEIHDNEFIRGKVPMTKAEIRTISLSKMGLNSDSVIYDVGAGTGSVSIATALMNPDISVYAIEKNEEALKLIGENKTKFCADNVEIIGGEASKVIENIEESPSHAFIGGSGGHMEAIIEAIMKRNSNTRFVINSVTPETLSEIMDICDKYEKIPDITQIFAARGEKIGGSTIMKALNPVYIISF